MVYVCVAVYDAASEVLCGTHLWCMYAVLYMVSYVAHVCGAVFSAACDVLWGS